MITTSTVRLCASVCAAALSFAVSLPVQAQLTPTSDADLKLAADSPFRDPDIIYLEADELVDDEDAGTLTASGEVEGRYQDRTLRADRVTYDINSGRVIAEGNVVLIDANGSSQYASKLDLSNKLEAGTAADFTARFAEGGVTGAKFAKRRADGGIELYNAYYTACEACIREDGTEKKPSWRIKARRVIQDKDDKYIQYRDAVFEFKGIPIFYSPYLAHPDPSAGRESGWLIPFGGLSGSKGLNFRTPYYFALSPSSELTLEPRIYQKTNPLLAAQYRKKFHTGEVNVEGSFTYASFFDSRGQTFGPNDVFADPEESLEGRRWRSHLFADGNFNLSDTWSWGFGIQTATDDLYLDRYDLEENPRENGLYTADGRRLVEQLYLVGQKDDFRFSASSFGFQSLRSAVRRDPNNPNLIRVSREDDSTLPFIIPKLELTQYFEDPIAGGRLKLFGDFTLLSREVGTDYARGTAGVNWSKTMIAPGGIEVKPFAEARFDAFTLEEEGAEQFDFSRSLGQVGVDIRYPLVKSTGSVDWTIEPRILLTQNFGESKFEQFTSANGVDLQQDSLDIDLDEALLFTANKATGYDLWQEGFRADVGGSLSADFGKSRVSAFVGQSYSSDNDNPYDIASGLSGNSSDLVGALEVNIDNKFISNTRVRYDDNDNKFRRLDTSFSYNSKFMRTNFRYYKVDSAARSLIANPLAPSEELSGGVTVPLFDNWSTRYKLFKDIDQNVLRRQELSLIYDDDCTRIEFVYDKNENNLGIVGNSEGFGIRVSLKTLGDFAPD